MKRNFSKGQGMLEYILLFASVIAVLLAVLAPKRGFIAKAIYNSLDQSMNVLENQLISVEY